MFSLISPKLIRAITLATFCVLGPPAGLYVLPTHANQSQTELLESNETQERTLRIINYLIEEAHYRSVELNDAFSATVLEEYIAQLDSSRSFFLAEDIRQMDPFRYQLDDFIQEGNLEPAFLIYQIYRERVMQRVEYAIHRLKQPFDFTLDEEFELDRSDADWLQDNDELDELWRRRIKNDILTLRLTGKDPDEILDTLEVRYQLIAKRAGQFKSGDIFQTFTNAYINSIEPHTTYYSPRATENFNINMRLSLEGIGAVLQTENEYTLIRRVVPGGPADLSGALKAQDRIVGVGQEEGPIVDVVGWRLDDVVGLIRGPKNSVVRLRILPGKSGLHGETETISLVRDEIRLEDQAARKSVLEIGTGPETTRIGWIQLPSFYIDFQGMYNKDPNYRSTTRDVRRLLEEFKTEQISGLVIDLRGNGGGSLKEAIELTGLFIDKGPVVQVKNANGKINIDRDPDPKIVYKGPLAVLVDGYSASASEIFAGAMQDYRRGMIIGEPTFGKGTVQNMYSLDRFISDSDQDLGQLKITIAQFFRINGESTQFRGVIPDFDLDTTEEEFGERSYDNALPWDKIKRTRYTPYRKFSEPMEWALRMTRKEHEKRIAENPEFVLHKEISRLNQQQRDRKRISLNEAIRIEEREQWDLRRLELENRLRVAKGDSPLENIEALESLNDPNNLQSELIPDFFVKESANILHDYEHFFRMYGEKDHRRLTSQDAQS